MATEKNVRVYTVADQGSGQLLRLQERCGLESASLGGYISVILATHLAMIRKPNSPAELDAMVRSLVMSTNATLADSTTRLVAMIKQRRMAYYKEHRREFVPESVDETHKGSNSPKQLGKYGDRLRLSKYLSAPMSEADMTYALTHMMGFASNVAVLRTVKPEPPTFSAATSTGYKGAEEQRAALIQQRAFYGNTVFVETVRVRDAGYVDMHGNTSVMDRADGVHTTHDVGCGMVTHCLPLPAYLHSIKLEGEAAQPNCSPFIVDVSSDSLPSSNGFEFSSSVFDFAVPADTVNAEGQGHHVVAVPVSVAGKRTLLVFDSRQRTACYKSEGLVYSQERTLADALNYSADGRRLPVEDDQIHPGAFTHRRCKLCQVVHASDMHAEFQ